MLTLGPASGRENLGGDAEVSGPGNGVGERTHPSQRCWSDEERARIVSETYEPGASIKCGATNRMRLSSAARSSSGCPTWPRK